MNIVFYVIAVYLIIINVLAYVLMGVDKKRSKKKEWRIREKTLFIIASAGGSIGSILGMKIFRHKTKHKSFTIGMPFILLVQCILVYLIFLK